MRRRRRNTRRRRARWLCLSRTSNSSLRSRAPAAMARRRESRRAVRWRDHLRLLRRLPQLLLRRRLRAQAASIARLLVLAQAKARARALLVQPRRRHEAGRGGDAQQAHAAPLGERAAAHGGEDDLLGQSSTTAARRPSDQLARLSDLCARGELPPAATLATASGSSAAPAAQQLATHTMEKVGRFWT